MIAFISIRIINYQQFSCEFSSLHGFFFSCSSKKALVINIYQQEIFAIQKLFKRASFTFPTMRLSLWSGYFLLSSHFIIFTLQSSLVFFFALLLLPLLFCVNSHNHGFLLSKDFYQLKEKHYQRLERLALAKFDLRLCKYIDVRMRIFVRMQCVVKTILSTLFSWWIFFDSPPCWYQPVYLLSISTLIIRMRISNWTRKKIDIIRKYVCMHWKRTKLDNGINGNEEKER